MAMAGGIGGGVCVWLLPLTGVADWGWRIPFAASLIWLAVAVSLRRHLPETIRFEARHAEAPKLRTPRLGAMATIAFFSNLFVAPASFFQNRYLEDVRGYTNSKSANGETGLLAYPSAIEVAFVGMETVQTAAGIFDGQHYQLRWQPQWPVADLWVNGDDGLFIRLTWDLNQSRYELTELRTLA